MMANKDETKKLAFTVISESVGPKGEVHSETFGEYDTIGEAQETAHALFRTHKYTSIEVTGKDLCPGSWGHIDSLEWKCEPTDEPRDFEVRALDFFGNRERISIYSYEVPTDWSISPLRLSRAMSDNVAVNDNINSDTMCDGQFKGTRILSLSASKALVVLATVTSDSITVANTTDLSASIASDASGDAPSLIADTSDDEAGVVTPDIGATTTRDHYKFNSLINATTQSPPFGTSTVKARGLQRVAIRRRPDGTRRIATFFIGGDDDCEDDD